MNLHETGKNIQYNMALFPEITIQGCLQAIMHSDCVTVISCAIYFSNLLCYSLIKVSVSEKCYLRVATNCHDKIPWLFHDRETKFHDLLICIHKRNIYIYIFSQNSMTFPEFQKISKCQKVHDFSMTVATLYLLEISVSPASLLCLVAKE